MKFGLFYQLPAWPGQDPERRYQETLDQIALGDALGFDVAWLAEMHFIPEFSILPSPLVLGAAAAARTRRIRIGIGVTLLALHDPIRAAEDAATLDLLSAGRLEYGIGRGSIVQHFDGFGIPFDERTDRFLEGLEVIVRAWSDQAVGYQGHHRRYAAVNVVPKPLQRPHPPIRIAANSDESIELAAVRGLPVMVSTVTATDEELRRRAQMYRRLRAEAGHPETEGEIALSAPVYVAEDGDQARRDVQESLMRYLGVVAQTRLGSYLAQGGDPNETPPPVERLQRLSYDDALEVMGIIGDPEEVFAKIRARAAAYGCGQIICWFNPGGLTPHRRVTASMRLFMRAVHPRLCAEAPPDGTG